MENHVINFLLHKISSFFILLKESDFNRKVSLFWKFLYFAKSKNNKYWRIDIILPKSKSIEIRICIKNVMKKKF